MKKTIIFYYDNKIVKAFLYATIFWAFFGFLIGIFIATLLIFPELPNFIFGTALKNSHGCFGYGRLRMIHTTTVVFAFVGNIIFAGSYYSLQRLLKTRIYSDVISWLHFWGWQIFIFLSWITFFIGLNTSKEYSEHEWPLDLLIGITWLFYGLNIFGSILKRNVKHLYVAVWFFLATWIAILVLHVFNNLEIPISFFSFKSYSIYAGVQDALMQWWYGHNAVAFFLTTPILGLMYYFVPKILNKPIFSYKLSIVHFWSLIFIYIWAGPHHLIYTALPTWAQVLGTIFSIMLIAPSWGGMINGLLTFRGSWNKIYKNPILKFFIVSLISYGIATFDGPMLATKTLNSIGHYTDWVIAHVHLGALGWNGFIAFGIIYYLVSELWVTKIYSLLLVNIHFWLGFIGIILYVAPMYTGAVIQARIWKEFNIDGTLMYKNFIDSVNVMSKFYKIRLIGGILYFIGFLVMIFNILVSINKNKNKFIANEKVRLTILQVSNNPINQEKNKFFIFHSWLEKKPVQFLILTFLVVSIGGAFEIIPTMVIKSNIPIIYNIKPYSPLELEGRDIYIREGCNSCHSQMIRPFRDEVLRYGDYSKAGEFIYDHPFLWGSKRTGPDLAREGGKKSNSWHFKHMYNPRFVSKGSVMPCYPWLFFNKINLYDIQKKMIVMKKLGVPYTTSYINKSFDLLNHQAKNIALNIMNESSDIKKLFNKEYIYLGDRQFIPLEKLEIVALISYLQRLGVDIHKL